MPCVAAFAYLLLPVTGLVAYLFGDERARFHGLQAILFGALWPLGLYAASALAPGATRAVFAAGAVVWLGAILATAMGRDPALPGLRTPLTRWAEQDPRAPV